MPRDAIITFTGTKISITNPRAEDVNIIDIAHHLSNICRYCGACRYFYSIAQHSVYVSLLCDPEFALEGLLHDATEAYLNDVCTPVKHLPEMQPYRALEEKHQKCIAEKFDLRPHPSIKTADLSILNSEVPFLMPDHPEWGYYCDATAPKPMEITEAWIPEQAKRMFLDRYLTISGERGRSRLLSGYYR